MRVTSHLIVGHRARGASTRLVLGGRLGFHTVYFSILAREILTQLLHI